MTAGSDSERAVAGGLVVTFPCSSAAGSRALAASMSMPPLEPAAIAGLLAAADVRVIGIDRDPSAIALGADLVQAAGGRLTLAEGGFSQLEAVARGFGFDAVDGVVLDVGVSSMQLDEAERGFSFRHDGPLDMRMGREADRGRGRGRGVRAPPCGDHRRARRRAAGARRRPRHRRRAPRRADPHHARARRHRRRRGACARADAIHPATRTFQALRIFVNEELSELLAGLAGAERLLRPGGRLVIVTFHSLEDGVAKSFLAERSRPRGPSRHRPDVRSWRHLPRADPAADRAGRSGDPCQPRARSAKLRAAERTAAPVATRLSVAPLPRLPSLAEVMGRPQPERRR